MNPFWLSVCVAAATALLPRAAAADEKRPVAAAFVAGAAVLVGGMTAGGTLVSASSGDAGKTTGWIAMDATFGLAPIVSHGLVGEWGRGLAFAAVPVGAVAGTSVLAAYNPDVVTFGINTKRVTLWSLFTAALASGTAGVADTALAASRAPSFRVTPVVGALEVGLQVGGVL